MGWIDDSDANELPFRVSNACIYTTYCVFLVLGLAVAWLFRNSKQYLGGNGTRSAIPLALNFIASGMGAGILLTYPQIAAQSGLHGLLTYAACGGIPMLLFAALGPIIRRHTPKGFVVTEWIRQRYGVSAALVFSGCTILTLFLFMVSELTSVLYTIETLTGMDGLPALIVEAIFTAIYTSFGGFLVSFFTDNIQAAMFLILLIVCTIAIGCEVQIDTSLIGPSGLLKANKLSWKLLYILFVAIMTNDCFMAGFWVRTFAAKTDRDLWIGCSLAAMILFSVSALVGVPGLLAVWSGAIDPASDTFYDDSGAAFFILLRHLPRWIHAFTLVFVTALSTCVFDSLQSAFTSTVSNDWFRNRVRMVWVRAFTLAVMAPVIVVALRAPNVLNIYLIADILSSAVVPVIFLGLSSWFTFITGFEIICSIIGGILTVFIFGCVFYGNASEGASLLLLENGIYGDDWSAFGVFVAAPVGSLIGCLVALVARSCYIAFTEKTSPLAIFDKERKGNFDDKFWAWLCKEKWYVRCNFGPWAKKLDHIIFLKDGVTCDDESILANDFWFGESSSDSASAKSPKSSLDKAV